MFRRFVGGFVWTLGVFSTMSTTLLANDERSAIEYSLRFPQPSTHYVEIEASIPTDGRDEVECFMPVWTPGSYLVREYSRHVEAVRAEGIDGQAIEVSRSRKNRWRVRCQGLERFKLRYRVYCREMGVQTNWVDADFAILNGAGTFLTTVDSPPRPHRVRVHLPESWKRSICGLPPAEPGASNDFLATNFNVLVDSPIYAGNGEVFTFEVDGKPHELVIEGGGGVWDGPRSARDAEAIVREQARFWGGLPYDRYVFFNLLTETGGGLEHRNSTVLMFSRWGTRTRRDYLNWLFLVSHEFFHTWNVKRLRPEALGPFDYENEVHTPDLWVAEGLTSYYERLFVRRAGLCTVEEYLAGDPPRRAGDSKSRHEIEQIQETEGRQVQSLSEASYNAWIKFYRRDENTNNTAISYYTKGAVVGFLLDARIRKATAGRKSLDDLMRLAYDRFSGERGFRPDEFRALASEVAGEDLSSWFEKTVDSTEELDYPEALQWFGLRFTPEKPATPTDDPKKAWLGIETRGQGGQLTVQEVRRGTPGYEAGFNVGDEILAIGEDRVLPDQWSQRMGQYRPGESISVLINRRGRLRRIEATFGEEPARVYVLEKDPDATPEQVAHRKAWLGEADSEPDADKNSSKPGT